MAERHCSNAGLGIYMAERHWPGVTADILVTALMRIKVAAEAQPPDSIVRHLQSTLVPDEELVFSLYEASSSEAVEQANRIAGISLDHVAAAVLISSEGPPLAPPPPPRHETPIGRTTHRRGDSHDI